MNAVSGIETGHAGRQDRSSRDGNVDRCHLQMMIVVCELELLAAAVERHGFSGSVRASARSIASFFSTDAQRHHQDEERHIFPWLLANAGPGRLQAVLELQQDHRWLEEDWLKLAPQVQAVADGVDRNDRATLRQDAALFAALHRNHIAREDALIDLESRAKLHAAGRLLASRQPAAQGSSVALLDGARGRGPRPAIEPPA